MNKTEKGAVHIHGTDPQNLVEKILRGRIYSNNYWKEHCFALTAETLVDKAMDLKSYGGTYGGNKAPTPFICLILKMLQIQPEKEIIVEFIRNPDYKYVRLLGAFYLRLTGKPTEIYDYLEPLYNDFRKIRRRGAIGYDWSHVDEFIDELLAGDYSCDLQLPFLPKRTALEDAGQLDPRVSSLDDDLDSDGDSESDDKKKGNAKNSEESSHRESQSESHTTHRKVSPDRRSPDRRSPDRRSPDNRTRERSPHKSYDRERRNDKDNRSERNEREDERRDRDNRNYSSRRNRDDDREDRRYRGGDSNRNDYERRSHRDDRNRDDGRSRDDDRKRKDRESDNNRSNHKKQREDEQGGGAKESMSIEETNKQREKFGMKPLK